MDKTEIRAKLRQINEILNSLESTEISPALELALNDLFFQEENKLSDREQIDNIIATIEYIQSRIKKIKQKAKSLFQIIEHDTNTARYLELYLIKCLRDREIDYLETQNYNLEIVSDSNRRELVVNKGVAIMDIPEEYQKLCLEIDYSSVRKTLESGGQLDFASLSEPKFYLKIHKSRESTLKCSNTW